MASEHKLTKAEVDARQPPTKRPSECAVAPVATKAEEKRAKVEDSDRAAKTRLVDDLRLQLAIAESALSNAVGDVKAESSAADQRASQEKAEAFAAETAHSAAVIEDSPAKPSLKAELEAGIQIGIDSD